LKQIGRELNVRYVLEGSIQRSGNRLRVNVQLDNDGKRSLSSTVDDEEDQARPTKQPNSVRPADR
jgi:TolB-like protein